MSNLYYTPIIAPTLDIDTLDPIYKIFVPCKTGEERSIDFTGVTWARYSDELVYVEPTDKARGIRKMMAVSYTHLDVYKRQVLWLGDVHDLSQRKDVSGYASA